MPSTNLRITSSVNRGFHGDQVLIRISPFDPPSFLHDALGNQPSAIASICINSSELSAGSSLFRTVAKYQPVIFNSPFKPEVFRPLRTSNSWPLKLWTLEMHRIEATNIKLQNTQELLCSLIPLRRECMCSNIKYSIQIRNSAQPWLRSNSLAGKLPF